MCQSLTATYRITYLHLIRTFVFWRHLGASCMQRAELMIWDLDFPQCGTERCMILVEDHGCFWMRMLWPRIQPLITLHISTHVGVYAGFAADKGTCIVARRRNLARLWARTPSTGFCRAKGGLSAWLCLVMTVQMCVSSNFDSDLQWCSAVQCTLRSRSSLDNPEFLVTDRQ